MLNMLLAQSLSFDRCSFSSLQPPQDSDHGPGARTHSQPGRVGLASDARIRVCFPVYRFFFSLPLPLPLPLQLLLPLLLPSSPSFEVSHILLGLLGLGALGCGPAEVVWDPRFVVVLVDAAGDAGGLIAGEGLGHIDDLLRLLLGQRGLLSLWEESLDPGLVDEVEGASERAGQEEVEEDTVTL